MYYLADTGSEDAFLVTLMGLTQANLNVTTKKEEVLELLEQAPYLKRITVDGDLGGTAHEPGFIRRLKDMGISLQVRTRAYKGVVWHSTKEESDAERLSQPI